MSDEVIELCVSAQAREGEANKAVVKLFSEVSWVVFEVSTEEAYAPVLNITSQGFEKTEV